MDYEQDYTGITQPDNHWYDADSTVHDVRNPRGVSDELPEEDGRQSAPLCLDDAEFN